MSGVYKRNLLVPVRFRPTEPGFEIQLPVNRLVPWSDQPPDSSRFLHVRTVDIGFKPVSLGVRLDRGTGMIAMAFHPFAFNAVSDDRPAGAQEIETMTTIVLEKRSEARRGERPGS